jgi:hypothetical protein
LWHSATAGGVANIWGHLLPDSDRGGSQPYDRGNARIKHLIKTYATFFRDKRRFRADFVRDNGLADPRTGTTETPEPADISACLRGSGPDSLRFLQGELFVSRHGFNSDARFSASCRRRYQKQLQGN